MKNNRYPFVNTPLPYPYSALEPYIDEKTMQIHHDKHLQTYIQNLNAVVEKNPGLKRWTLEEMVTSWCRLPSKVGIEVRNNAGGVYNHRFFFDGMGQWQPGRYQYEIFDRITEQFCGWEVFISKFKETALGVFGSGYTWLILEQGFFKIITTRNQNVPEIGRQYPLLNLDVWEHAYYLKHYNVRAAYIEDWFKVINWEKIECRYQNNMKQSYTYDCRSSII